MKILSLSLLIALIAGNAQAAITMSLDPLSNLGADAYEEVDGASQEFSGSTIPTNTNVNAIYGVTHNKNNIDWYVSGAQTILSLGMDHRRTGDLAYDPEFDNYVGSDAGTGVSEIRFTANSNEPYKFSGYYNVTDVGASGS